MDICQIRANRMFGLAFRPHMGALNPNLAQAHTLRIDWGSEAISFLCLISAGQTSLWLRRIFAMSRSARRSEAISAYVLTRSGGFQGEQDLLDAEMRH